MNYFDLLPNEIIPLIINHINEAQDRYHCLLVNKQFNSATIPLVWRTLKINHEASFNNQFRPGLTRSMPSLGHHVRHLHLGSYSTDAILLNLMHHVPYLETLKIENALQVTDESIQYLPAHCPNLITVDLNRVPITTLSVIALGHHCPRLRTLVLREALDLSPTIFPALAHCPLTSLDISIKKCHNFNNLDWLSSLHQPDWLTGLDVSKAIGPFSRLTSLRIFSMSLVSGIGANILRTTTTTTTTTTLWPHLTHLILYACQGITTTELDMFLKSHPRITVLEMNGLPDDTNTFIAVANHLPDIRQLCIGSNVSATAPELCHFIHQCPSLTYLCYWNMMPFSESDFPGIFNADANDQDHGQPFDTDRFMSGEFLEEDINLIRRRQPDPW